ncbi:MAG TPA: hypothetical protein VK550_20305 [Polyangiaceae bacterium]|nr:hypothetical protein [Polyangiaceae bacterium]
MTRASNERMTRALLGSFSRDEPSAPAKARAFAAFGVAAGVASVSSTASGAATDVASAAAPGAATVAKGALAVGGVSTVKALIAGAVIGGLVVHAGLRVATDYGDTRASNSPAAIHRPLDPVPREPALALAPTLASAENPPERGEVDPRPNEARAVSARSSPVAPRARSRASARAEPPSMPDETSLAPDEAASAGTSSSATLTGEVARLDRVRAALREGSPARAMRELDSYAAEFANGTLGQEAAVLRIELLVELGDAERARALANAFAAAHPKSGYMNKIQELLARRAKRSVR